MPRKRLEKQFSERDLEEFRVLIKNLVPATLEQAEWICSEAERILHEHPELMIKLEDWEEISDEERKDIEKIIASILKHAPLEEGKRREDRVEENEDENDPKGRK